MIQAKEPFEFPISAEKSVSILVKIFFFFEDHLILGEKPYQFAISAKKSVLISYQPFESDSTAMKIRVKVAYSSLTLSKKPPLPFSKSWLRA